MTAMVLLLMFLNYLSVSSGAFDEVPVSQEVATGTEAIFRCRHSMAGTIRWRVNGSLVGRTPPPDIIPDIIRYDNGSLVDTLSITARPMYNETEVVCVARFDDQRSEELSQPVALIVLMNASAVDDVFLISPTSLNITVNAIAVFQCQHPTAHGINWMINGSILQDLPEGFSTDRSDDRVFSLNIEALAEYNQTVIQCVAFFIDSQSEESEQSLMMIQGILQSVTNLSRNGSTISWSPPFSLNLTNIEPDIVYCVEVYNITCGERVLIISDCDDVTEPNYSSDDLLDGYIYEYIVTPRSNVSRARNGTPNQPLRELFAIFSVNSPRLMAEDSSMMYMYEAELNYNKTKTSNRQMPSTCMLLLESLDGLSDSKETIACNRDSNPINLEVHPRRLWKCTVLANGCRNDSVLEEYPELSTHDVQNISVSSPRMGSIAVTGDFIQGSTAIGVLIITINSSNGTQYHLYHRNGNNNMQIEDTISGLADGDHRVSAFVLERSGHPFNRTATTPKSVVVTIGSESAPSSAILYDLLSNFTHICVTCMFKSSAPTSCLVVVHQRISQLSSSGLMNIESSHKFTRSGDTAYGCIQTNLEEYQVGVVDGKLFANMPQEGPSSACVACIAGSVLAVVVFVVSTLVVVIIALIYYRKMLKDQRQDVLEASVYTMDTSSRNQYEHIPLSTPTKVELSIGENMPLVSTHRVESVGHTEGNNHQMSFQTPPTFSPPMIPQAAAELTEEAVEATKIIYSKPDHHPNPGVSAPPPQGDEPQYSSVSNFKNSQGVVYACHVVKPLSTTTQPLIIDDSTKTTSEYSELIHPPNCQAKPATTLTATHSNNGENSTSPFVPSPPTPRTVGNLLPLLRPIASKWWSLGEALSIDEDDLDIINTNNETDEACLQDMLEFHEEKSDFQHTWGVMATALKQINQEGLPEKMQGLHIQPCDEDNVPELPLYEYSDSNCTSGYSSGMSPSADLGNSSDNEDEGYADAGHDTKLTETSEIVCSAEKVPELINDGHDGQQMMSFHPNKVHERPMMENREEQQLGRFFENPENLAGPLVPPQQLSPEGTSHREIREGQIEPESSYYH